MTDKRKNLQKLFSIANDNPKQAQAIIEGIVKAPYKRSQADNLTTEYINKSSDYHVENYYHDFLYKIWNYAEKQRNWVNTILN